MSESESQRAIANAVGRVKNVRTVPLVRLAHEDATERAIAVVRVGLPPLLPPHRGRHGESPMCS